MKRVLVVDDDAISCMLFTVVFEEEGLQVRSAATVEEACEIASTFHPDAAICDWMLNGAAEGLDAAKALQRAVPGISIVFVTGMSREVVQSAAQGIRYDGVFVKPVDTKQLLDFLISLPRATQASASAG